MKKTLLAVSGLAVITFGLAFAQSQTTTLSFWHTYNSDSDENKTLMEKVIPAFEKANPEIKIDAQAVPYPDFRQKLLTSVAGGTPPDLARLDIIWSPEFAKAGYIEKLDGYAGFGTLKAAVFKGPLSTNAFQGGYYGLPLDTNTQIMLYNTDLLKAAGVGIPKTMNDLKSFLEKTRKLEGGKVTQYGVVIPGPYNWHLLPWLWSNGGAVTDSKVSKATGYLNSAKNIATIEMINTWMKSEMIPPTLIGGGLGSWEGLGANQYVGGQDGPWAYPALKKQYPNLNLTHALFPSGAGGSISVVGGENIAIFKDSKSKDAAWKFLQFMLSKTTQLTMAPTGQIPVINAAAADPYIKNHPYFGLYLEQLKTAKARTVHPAYPKMEEIMQGAFADVFGGKKAAKQALTEAAAQIDQLLK